MERIVKAQALTDASGAKTWVGKKVMEINPKHPIIIELNRLVKENDKSVVVEDTVQLLLESAALSSGYQVDDPNQFASRIQRIIGSSLDVELPPEEPRAAPSDSEDGEEGHATKDKDEL